MFKAIEESHSILWECHLCDRVYPFYQKNKAGENPQTAARGCADQLRVQGATLHLDWEINVSRPSVTPPASPGQKTTVDLARIGGANLQGPFQLLLHALISVLSSLSVIFRLLNILPAAGTSLSIAQPAPTVRSYHFRARNGGSASLSREKVRAIRAIGA